MSQIGANWHYFEDSVARCLWLLGYLQRERSINSGRYTELCGASKRTFRRDCQRLRSAGFILLGRDGCKGGVDYGGFDPSFAEFRRERAA